MAAAAALIAAACAPRPAAPEVSAAALGSHLSRLAEPLALDDSAAVARRARYAAERLRAARVQPASSGSFLVPSGAAAAGKAAGNTDPSRAHVMGYVAGRNPNFASDLVLLTADLNSAGAAAVLETARVFVAKGLTEIVPEASLGIALWAPPRGGATGVRDYLDRPRWAVEAISRVLHVTHDSTGVEPLRREWERAGIAFQVVTSVEPWPLPLSDRREARQLAGTFALTHAAARAAQAATSGDQVRRDRRQPAL